MDEAKLTQLTAALGTNALLPKQMFDDLGYTKELRNLDILKKAASGKLLDDREKKLAEIQTKINTRYQELIKELLGKHPYYTLDEVKDLAKQFMKAELKKEMKLLDMDQPKEMVEKILANAMTHVKIKGQ
uniref:Uncharacterized protein n=1 Tax=Percolomonas cosmopolitus TaxID=63605 RepID=A0A7S1PHK5_9EUKA|mmetsp:Transcript_5777/g.21835  ORF Transcript_5777/g.21835 Transcript_5777/m.21835 type:complete len:130 (+) Transcript_5777:223-612(+)